MAKPKRRVTYTKEMRASAKEEGAGLVTIQIEHRDGNVVEKQILAGPLQCRFADWALAFLASPEVHKLPNLEQIYRQAMEETP